MRTLWGRMCHPLRRCEDPLYFSTWWSKEVRVARVARVSCRSFLQDCRELVTWRGQTCNIGQNDMISRF